MINSMINRKVKSVVHSDILSVEDVQAGYDKHVILSGISLKVKQGQIVALIGPNGAGKSTLLKIIAGLLKPITGRILFKGEDITHFPVHRRTKAGIAYIVQGGAVFPSLTAFDHIRLGRRIAKKNHRFDGLESYKEILDSALKLGRDKAGVFSGGQRQILATATMLATNPYLLLCDEPSAGLSPVLARTLVERLARISRESNLSVLWVEQQLSNVLSIADQAIFLRNGTIVAETSDPKKWLATEAISRLAIGETWETGL